MDNENFNRQMEFIINQQAQFSADMIELKTQLTELTGTVANLAVVVRDTAETVKDMAGNLKGLEESVERNRADTQEAINNLIVANEVTRDLTQKVARLAMQTSQRVSDLESKQ